jgi:hypothetical protein
MKWPVNFTVHLATIIKGPVPNVRVCQLEHFFLSSVDQLASLFQYAILPVSDHVLLVIPGMPLIFLQVLTLLFLSLHHVYVHTPCSRPICHMYVESTENTHNINVSPPLLVSAATPIPRY